MHEESNTKKQKYIIWDAHACPTLKVGSDLSALFKYKSQGYNFVSLNVGFEAQKQEEIFNLLKYYNKHINENSSHFILAKRAEDIIEAKKANKLAIAYDIEGINNLENNKKLIGKFYELGVRQLALIYNKNNQLGGGCQDDDIGLTSIGYDCIEEMNRIGMLIDCSHASYRTSLDIINASKFPVIFSHSNPYTLCDNPRNIHDEQIIACAKGSGVIGINGINIFLANKEISACNIIRHIDYIYNLVGPRHVGFGFDYVFEHKKTLKLVDLYPEKFPNREQYFNIKMANPNILNELLHEMEKKRYSETDIKNIMGYNFFRVANAVWKN